MIKGANIVEEKILILKMLEEGKITTEEALKLLESLDKKNDEIKREEKSTSEGKLNDTINKFSKKAEEFAERIGPDFITKVENVSMDFADAAVKFADKMVNFFSNTDIYKNVSKNFSFPINNPENLRFKIKTQNLAITVDTSDTSEVYINMKLNLLEETTDIDIDIDIDKYIFVASDDNLININTDFPNKIWGKLEIKLPKNIENFEIETNNSKCIIDDIRAQSLCCNTSNGKIELSDSSFKKLQASTNNGKIILSHCQASCAFLDTSNSSIEIENSSFDKLSSGTTNGNIHLSRFYSINLGEAIYELKTTNGKIIIALPKDNNAVYKINANTTLGNINISGLESSYAIDRNDANMKSVASILSSSYHDADNKVSIEASTTNASINIINE